MKIAKNKKNKKLIFAILILIVLSICSCTIVYLRRSQIPVLNSGDKNDANSSGPTISSQQEKTATNTHEDKSVKIPDSVNPNDIKNYKLIVENEKFKIRQLNNSYVVTLYAIINNPGQSEMYYDQLREYKKEAINYMTNHSINTDEGNITYEPDEANNL